MDIISPKVIKRKAYFSASETLRILTLLSLSVHGFETSSIKELSGLLNNHDAPPAPNTIQKVGFGRVYDGLVNKEPWTFKFGIERFNLERSEDQRSFIVRARKSYQGYCRIGGEGNSEIPKDLIPEVNTIVDLSMIYSSAQLEEFET